MVFLKKKKKRKKGKKKLNTSLLWIVGREGTGPEFQACPFDA
jgi:hypothetical protein